MAKVLTYPSPLKTRAVYPPLSIARQTLIIPNIIEWRHKDWGEYIESPGNYSYVVDNLRTEYIYAWIWASQSSTVVLSNPVLGRVEINVTSGSYENVFRSGGQPINIEITTSGESYIYLSEGMLVTGEAEVIRVRPRSLSELVTILGDDVVAGYRQIVYLEIPVIYGDVEYYVNGEYYDRGHLYETFSLDREIVVTAKGNGFIAMYYMIYPERITLDVDTAYIVPCPNKCFVTENDIDYYNTPCIYRNPTIEISKGASPKDFLQTLVLEISDQLKEYIDRYRTEVCGIGSQNSVQ